MVAAKFVNVAGEMSRIKKEIKSLKKQGGEAVADAALAAVTNYIAHTPVWSGEAIRNYKIGVGSPPTAVSSPVGGRITYPGPVPDGVANEGRRGANAAAAIAQAQGALAKVRTANKSFGETVYIKNTINESKAGLIESGSAPTPQRSRYPGGQTQKAKQAALSKGGGNIR